MKSLPGYPADPVQGLIDRLDLVAERLRFVPDWRESPPEEHAKVTAELEELLTARNR